MKLHNLAFILATGVALLEPSAARAQALVQAGEIVVLEGDATTVTGSGGAYSIEGGNVDAILAQFYAQYPDEFDMVAIWTSFADLANGGAYFMSPPPVAAGLKGFINMNQVGFWTGFDALNTMGQEFGHYWLVWAVPNELLGRDGSHWSSLVDTEGSVVDGVDWTDNGDGTFTAGGIMTKFGPLDLWFMGYISDEEVGPFFRIENATAGGQSLSSTAIWEGMGTGTVATGTRVDMTIEDIKAVSGPMQPPDMRQHDFRVAFVLVTAPGETADMVTQQVADMEEIRLAWNDIYVEWTWGRGTMCTDTTAPCDIPHARFDGGKVVEGMPSDGDGVVEPGEHASVEVYWKNTGTSPTEGAQATLAVAEGIETPAPLPIATIPVGGVVTTTFDIVVPGGLACGQEYVFLATAEMGARVWQGNVTMIPGIEEGPIESFATSADWAGNVDGMDTATESGQWQYGPAETTVRLGYVLQPNGGRSGEDDSAWWTGREAGFDWLANDVDTGFTRLVSAPYDVSGLNEPKLRYYVWYQSMDFMVTPPAPSTGDDLVVEASGDEGVTWVEIDRVSGQSRMWERRDAPIRDVPGDIKNVRFRFTATDGGATQNLVEVGIDDVQIIAFSASCGAEGCGCKVGAADQKTPWVGLLGFLGLLGARGIRRRRSPAGEPTSRAASASSRST